MTKSEIEKAAKAFIGGKNPRCAKGCFITLDGSLFYRDYSGLQFARGHAGNPNEVFEFDENGKLVTPKDPDKERVELITKISTDPSNKYRDAQLANLSNESLRKLVLDLENDTTTTSTDASNDDGDDEGDTINLDKMKHGELVALLQEIDPTHEITKETKAQLKDLIVASNALTDHNDEKLISMIKAFSSEIITDDMTDEDVTKVLNTDELKAVVLNLRDEVELDQEIGDKLFALGDSEGSEDTQGGDEGDNDGASN